MPSEPNPETLDQTLERLEGLHAKATKGPWQSTADTLDDDAKVDQIIDATGFIVAQLSPEGGFDDADWNRCLNDGRYVAALHNAFPSIASAIRALMERERVLTEALQGMFDTTKNEMRLNGLPMEWARDSAMADAERALQDTKKQAGGEG